VDLNKRWSGARQIVKQPHIIPLAVCIGSKKTAVTQILYHIFLASNSPRLNAVSFSPTVGVGSLRISHRRK